MKYKRNIFVSEFLKNSGKNIVPSLREKLKSVDDFNDWKRRFIQELKKTLKINKYNAPEPDIEELEVYDREDYILKKIIYNTFDDLSVPAYMLIPKKKLNNRSSILCLHGHYPTDKDVLAGFKLKKINRNFAEVLVKSGYTVIAADQINFGERMEEDLNIMRNMLEPIFAVFERTLKRPCNKSALLASLTDMTLDGIRVIEAQRAIDVLLNYSESNSSSIGCMGVSSGGLTALFVSALDSRIKCSVAAACFGSYKDLLFNTSQCMCGYIPDLMSLFDMGDICAAICPRPLNIQIGKTDNYFDYKCSEDEINHIKYVYNLLSESDKLNIKIYEFGHDVNIPDACEWFNCHLK